jgi:hypothetical protein
MKWPRFATAFWFTAFVAVAILLLMQQPWVKTKSAWDELVGTGDQNMLFGEKNFTDTGDDVLISGTLTGNGVGY